MIDVVKITSGNIIDASRCMLTKLTAISTSLRVLVIIFGMALNFSDDFLTRASSSLTVESSEVDVPELDLSDIFITLSDNKIGFKIDYFLEKLDFHSSKSKPKPKSKL